MHAYFGQQKAQCARFYKYISLELMVKFINMR